MVIPTPDSGVLKRLYAGRLASGGLISLDIPDCILQRLYTYVSLKGTEGGAQFYDKNRLQDAKVTCVS
jgi:hydroxymethylglutaryl-CoA reductase (NADPH)